MNIRPVEAVDQYSVAMVKKSQDEEQRQGEANVRLIEAANAGPRKVEPREGSTVSVIA